MKNSAYNSCWDKLKEMGIPATWEDQVMNVAFNSFFACSFPQEERTWEIVEEYYSPLLFLVRVKPAILKWLEENHPQAWFKPMFMTQEQQRELGFPV